MLSGRRNRPLFSTMINDRKPAPYGSWKSPITAELFASSYLGVEEPCLVEGGQLYWKENRPLEGGRGVLMSQDPSGASVELTPKEFNVRTTVHEYGGGDYVAVEKGRLYFSNYKDQRLYCQVIGSQPSPITPAGVDIRYADGAPDRGRNRLIMIREDHTVANSECVNSIVSIDLNEGSGQVLVSGNDFYSDPRLSPDGSRLCWLTWNHPNMPWDGTELWVASLGSHGAIEKKELVAGGIEESIFQPEWSSDGTLYFISDRTGWWNLYKSKEGKVHPLYTINAEFGSPHWLFRVRNYAFASTNTIICSYRVKGTSHLGRLDTDTGSFEEMTVPFTDILDIVADQNRAVLLAGSPSMPLSLVELDLESLKLKVLRKSRSENIDPRYLSIPETIEFPVDEGRSSYAFYYAPRNDDYVAPSNERPPLLVMSHGGPTASSGTTLRYGIQFWTSRGIAVADVEYRGSTGYGREYRRHLEGKWGLVDVEDCIGAARYLVKRGDVDRKRLAITGGSAGGYTTLRALTSSNVFSAGASYYGISDLDALAKDTHKFESRYMDRLVGTYNSKLYRERSPIHFADRLSCPLILFQGKDDPVVPPAQSTLFYEAVRKKGLPTAYILFEGEKHGFLKAENLRRALEAELYFYSKIFGFEPADDIEPFQIDNIEKLKVPFPQREMK